MVNHIDVPRTPVLTPSRTVRYMNNTCVNGAVHARYLELQEQLRPYNTAARYINENSETLVDAEGNNVLNKDGHIQYIDLTPERKAFHQKFIDDNLAECEKLTAELQAIKGARIRFSESSGETLSNIVTVTTEAIIKHAIDNCLLGKTKTVNVNHLHTDTETLSVLPIVQRLPSWINPPVRETKSRKAAAAAKEGEEAAADAAAEPAAEEEVAEDVEEDAATEPQREHFRHYVEKICNQMCRPVLFGADFLPRTHDVVVKTADGGEKTVKEELRALDGPYAAIRTTSQFKDHVSRLMRELFERLSPQIQSRLTCMRAKTVTDAVILSVVRDWFHDGVVTSEELVHTYREIPDPVELARLREERSAERAAAKKENRQPKALRSESDLPKVKVLNIEKVMHFNGSTYSDFEAAMAAEAAKYPSKEK